MSSISGTRSTMKRFIRRDIFYMYVEALGVDVICMSPMDHMRVNNRVHKLHGVMSHGMGV